MTRRSPRSTLFPDTSLFRSGQQREVVGVAVRRRGDEEDQVGRAVGGAEVDLGVQPGEGQRGLGDRGRADRKSTRLNSSHANISYAVVCLIKKNVYESRDFVI